MSQTVLGEEIGVSFKQVQKYESGANRIGAGRLFEISAALETDVETLFEGAPPFDAPINPKDVVDAVTLSSLDRDCETLIEAYYMIQDRQLRQSFLSLLRTLSAAEEPTSSPKQ